MVLIEVVDKTIFERLIMLTLQSSDGKIGPNRAREGNFVIVKRDKLTKTVEDFKL